MYNSDWKERLREDLDRSDRGRWHDADDSTSGSWMWIVVAAVACAIASAMMATIPFLL